jgi:hypothetical protein
MQPLHLVAIAYGCAEVLLAWSHRSGRREASGGADAQSHDQGTLVLLWIAISASIGGAKSRVLAPDKAYQDWWASLHAAAEG